MPPRTAPTMMMTDPFDLSHQSLAERHGKAYEMGSWGHLLFRLRIMTTNPRLLTGMIRLAPITYHQTILVLFPLMHPLYHLK